MAAVLVTGASGSLGRHVVRELAEAGHATRRLVHRSRPLQVGVDDRAGDLTTGAGLEHALEGVDAVPDATGRLVAYSTAMLSRRRGARLDRRPGPRPARP